MITITKYDSEHTAQLKYYMQLRDYYSALQAQYPAYAAQWSNYVARKPAPSVDPGQYPLYRVRVFPQTIAVPVEGWVNYAPRPTRAKRTHEEFESQSRQPAKVYILPWSL